MEKQKNKNQSPTKQTFQKGHGDVLNKGLKASGEPVEVKTDTTILKDQTRNESEEERINKRLITDYILFNADCVENYIRGWKEIQGLYKIKLELKHLL